MEMYVKEPDLENVCFTEISLPSSQFFLEVQESSICALDAKTSIATGQEIGSTDIVLTDKSILTLYYSAGLVVSGCFAPVGTAEDVL